MTKFAPLERRSGGMLAVRSPPLPTRAPTARRATGQPSQSQLQISGPTDRAEVEAERDLVLKAFRDAGFKDVRAGLGPPGSALREHSEVGSGAFFPGTR